MATRGRPPKQLGIDTRRLQDYPRHDRDNALKVQGAALRELGQRYGIPQSSMDRMDEDKLRRQIGIAQSNLAQAEVV
jgi:lambda repressor-like predicted transcriptional regulator